MTVETRATKYDQTVNVAINLGVDPKHADQMVRGAVVLPHGTGATVRVAVFAKGEKASEAQKVTRIPGGSPRGLGTSAQFSAVPSARKYSCE